MKAHDLTFLAGRLTCADHVTCETPAPELCRQGLVLGGRQGPRGRGTVQAGPGVRGAEPLLQTDPRRRRTIPGSGARAAPKGARSQQEAHG